MGNRCPSAWRISQGCLQTPEKMVFVGSPPAAITRLSSPADKISKPEPNLANRFKIARLPLALTAADFVGVIGKGVIERLPMSFQRRAGINETRRANLISNFG